MCIYKRDLEENI